MKVPCYLGKYELFMRLGKNQEGKVYLARDTIQHREVAIKVFYESTDAYQTRFKKRSQRFTLDISAVAALTHPNIVSILEVTQSKEADYIALEYISGGNLLRYSNPKTLLPASTVQQIISKCCSALEYASSQGVMHGNIKPENILITTGSQVKITDFGNTLAYSEQSTQQRPGQVSAYHCPEQISGRPLTQTSDIYSLGVVAYQLLTGELPCMAENNAELFVGVSKIMCKPPSSYRPEITPFLDEVVLSMLSRNPRERFGSWAELVLKLSGEKRAIERNNTISVTEKFNMLRIKSELSEFTNDDILRFATLCNWTRLPADTIFVKENEKIQSTYILASGSIKVTQYGRLIHIIKRGEFFGEMCRSKSGMVQPAMLQMLTESIVAEFTSETIASLSIACQSLLKQKVLDTMTLQLMPEFQ
ncbi:MAG: serine/threonine-protein kinase [Gallionellaceae bacterium]|jgi:serine/threonine protein kinase